MTTATIEIEIPTSFPAEKVFKAFSDFDNIAPKVNPQVFKSINIIEGSGGVGTKRLFTFGDVVPYTKGKQRVDLVDASNNCYNFTFIEGDILLGILDSISDQVKIFPSANGGSVFKETIVYKSKGEDKPSEESLKYDKVIHVKTFKAIEAYIAAHPEAY